MGYCSFDEPEDEPEDYPYNLTNLTNLTSQCGIHAIKAYEEISGPYWNDFDYYTTIIENLTEKKIKHFIKEYIGISRCVEIAKKGEMDVNDIIKISCHLYKNLLPDMRYNSNERDVKGKLFLYEISGITALKFSDTTDLHWSVIHNGKLYPLLNYSENTRIFTDIKSLKEFLPNFDGFGHTICFREKEEMEVIKRYSKCSAEHCGICARKKWCIQKIN